MRYASAVKLIYAFGTSGYAHPAAEYLRIGIRRFAEEIFIVGTHGEKRGINSAQRSRKGYEFVPAEVQLYGYGLLV